MGEHQRLFLGVTLSVLGMLASLPAAELKVQTVWPGKPPGETKELPPEKDLWKDTDKPVGGRPIIKLTNVSTPTLTLYTPGAAQDVGTTIIICPGGGHSILAFDHEGTEVAEWLLGLGVRGAVLKYRVPTRNPQKRWEGAVQDAQRAVSLVRQQSPQQRIGILGFSAGGEVAGLTALFAGKRQYDPVDDVDQVSCRPDFGVLIYPAYFADKTEPKLRADLPISKECPPLFLVHAFDDPVTPLSSLLLATELKRLQVPVELHLYTTGGHGYGMRDTGHPVNSWPARCGDWLKHQGYLTR